MSKRVEAEIEAFKRGLLAERLALCTDAQRAMFACVFPDGVKEAQLVSAIDLCDRTIAKIGAPANRMDAPGAPACGCGRVSVTESGWCGVAECGLRPAEPDGVALIAAERRRQIGSEGFTYEHDDDHDRVREGRGNDPDERGARVKEPRMKHGCTTISWGAAHL